MPDLAKRIEKVSPAFLTSRVTGLNKKFSKKELNHAVAQIARLTDKAFYEYQFARDLILQDLNDREHLTLNFLLVVNHFENSINSIARVNKLFSFFSDREFRDTVPNELILQMKESKKKIVDFRDTIEHMDEHLIKVAKDQIPTSSLFVSSDALVIQILSSNRGKLVRHEISTENLALIIENMNKITRLYIEHGIAS